MKLDEAIKRASEVADTKLQDAELSEIQGCYNNLCARAADVPDTNVGELVSRQAAIDAIQGRK